MHVLVIGAGVQGIANAYFLNRQGYEVTVVDSAGAAGMQCSFGNGGGLTPSATAPWNDPGVYRMMLKYLGRKDAPMMFRLKALPSMIGWGLRFLSYAKEPIFIRNTILNTRLCNYSMKMMAEIDAETGLQYRATNSGLLMTFRDEQSQAALENFYDLLSEEGVSYESLDSAQTIARESSLKPVGEYITGSMYCAADGSADPHLFCQQMEQYTAAKGVNYRYNTAVQSLEKKANLFQASTAAGENIKADAVVIAAGCYSPQLGKSLGVKIPIKPAKGYSLTIPIEHWDNKPRTLVADMSLHAGLNPIGGQVLRVAGTAEFAGYDHSLNAARIANLVGLVEAVYPELAATMDRNKLNPWTGLRPMSVDSVGIIGKTGVENLYLSTGHGHLGWSAAAASGRLVADQIAGNRTEISAQDYSISRFG